MHWHLVTNRIKDSERLGSAEEAAAEVARAVEATRAEKEHQGATVTVTAATRNATLVSWSDEYLSGWQVIEATACTLDCEQGGAPMTVRAEVWGLSADEAGIWLISGGDAWRSGPIAADSDPHYVVEGILEDHQALGDAKIIHSTSWRAEDTSVILTYVVALDCPHVHDHWPGSQQVSAALAEVVGKPNPHAADAPPVPRYVDVLLHAIRHLRFLLDYDATAAAAFSPAWRQHLLAFAPALAGMYSDAHKPEVWSRAG